MEVVLDAIGELQISVLRRQKPLALFLEVGCLRLHGLELLRQAGKIVEEGQGVHQDLVDVFL